MGVGPLNRRLLLTASAAILALAAGARPGAAQPAPSSAVSTDSFVGAWELVEWISTDGDGDVSYPYGEHALGQVAYFASGRMSAHLMSAPGDGPRRDISYWGRFSVDTAAGDVTHHVIGSSQENFVGTDQVRAFGFEGEDRLILSVGNSRLTWARLR